MHITGVVIGLFAFLIIGLFHPIVIKSEYYLSSKIWPVFLLVGILLIGSSLFFQSPFIASALAVTGFTCLWSIKELKEQEQRVARGWFPANPKRKEKQ